MNIMNIPGYDVLVPTYHSTNHQFLLDTKTGTRGDQKKYIKPETKENQTLAITSEVIGS